MVSEATIVLLNGTSSSGKSSLAKAFQDAMEMPFLHAGIDHFLFMLPRRYINEPECWHQMFEYTYADQAAVAQGAPELVIRAAPLGLALMSSMHRAIAALAASGQNVVMDHVLLEPAWLHECLALFAPFRVLFVGVRCPLAVLEARERARRDRTVGQARAQYETVHAGLIYDLEVDTSLVSPEAGAQLIRQRLLDGPPLAFQQMQQALGCAL